MSAALIGSGVGLSLGAAYLAGGLAHHANPGSAQAAAGGYSSAILDDAGVLGATPAAGLTQRLNNSAGDQKVSAQAGNRGDLDCLTQAVYYEARGESSQGQFAVAQVVMNRVNHPAFPKTVCGVVFQGAAKRRGCQFSFACDGSMHARREGSAWRQARKVAGRVLAGAAVAEVGSATHFHTTGVSPAWGPQMRRVAQVGMHVFYRFNPRGVMQAAARPVLQQAVMTAALPEKPVEYRLTNALSVETPAPAPVVVEQAPAATSAATPAIEIKPVQAQPSKAADSAALSGTAASDAASS